MINGRNDQYFPAGQLLLQDRHRPAGDRSTRDHFHSAVASPVGAVAGLHVNVPGRVAMGKLQAEPWLVNAVLSGDLTVGELWAQYYSLGGHRTRQELQIYLNGESSWDEADYALLTQALTGRRH